MSVILIGLLVIVILGLLGFGLHVLWWIGQRRPGARLAGSFQGSGCA